MAAARMPAYRRAVRALVAGLCAGALITGAPALARPAKPQAPPQVPGYGQVARPKAEPAAPLPRRAGRVAVTRKTSTAPAVKAAGLNDKVALRALVVATN